MKRGVRVVVARIVASVLAMTASAAGAHSASDAYLTLDASATGGRNVIRAQWDVALRDLDFVMPLDDDGDGRITWKELRGHQPAIARYALANIAFKGDRGACTVTLADQRVSNHADGAYAALFFDVACGPSTTAVTLDYRLFFRIDPSHRAIVVSRSGSDAATALLSPDRATITLKVAAPAR